MADFRTRRGERKKAIIQIRLSEWLSEHFASSVLRQVGGAASELDILLLVPALLACRSGGESTCNARGRGTYRLVCLALPVGFRRGCKDTAADIPLAPRRRNASYMTRTAACATTWPLRMSTPSYTPARLPGGKSINWFVFFFSFTSLLLLLLLLMK